jgi:hypothetical protein
MTIRIVIFFNIAIKKYKSFIDFIIYLQTKLLNHIVWISFDYNCVFMNIN